MNQKIGGHFELLMNISTLVYDVNVSSYLDFKSFGMF